MMSKKNNDQNDLVDQSKMLAEFEKEVAHIAGKNTIVCIGRPQVGKTTAVNFMRGTNYELEEDERGIEQAKPCADTLKPLATGGSNELADTLYPKAYDMKGLASGSKLLDLPGVGAHGLVSKAREAVERILSYRAMKLSKPKGMLVFLDPSAFDNGAELIKVVRALRQTVKINTLSSDAIKIVITKSGAAERHLGVTDASIKAHILSQLKTMRQHTKKIATDLSEQVRQVRAGIDAMVALAQSGGEMDDAAQTDMPMPDLHDIADDAFAEAELRQDLNAFYDLITDDTLHVLDITNPANRRELVDKIKGFNNASMDFIFPSEDESVQELENALVEHAGRFNGLTDQAREALERIHLLKNKDLEGVKSKCKAQIEKHEKLVKDYDLDKMIALVKLGRSLGFDLGRMFKIAGAGIITAISFVFTVFRVMKVANNNDLSAGEKTANILNEIAPVLQQVGNEIDQQSVGTVIGQLTDMVRAGADLISSGEGHDDGLKKVAADMVKLTAVSDDTVAQFDRLARRMNNGRPFYAGLMRKTALRYNGDVPYEKVSVNKEHTDLVELAINAANGKYEAIAYSSPVLESKCEVSLQVKKKNHPVYKRAIERAKQSIEKLEEEIVRYDSEQLFLPTEIARLKQEVAQYRDQLNEMSGLCQFVHGYYRDINPDCDNPIVRDFMRNFETQVAALEGLISDQPVAECVSTVHSSSPLIRSSGHGGGAAKPEVSVAANI